MNFHLLGNNITMTVIKIKYYKIIKFTRYKKIIPKN